MTRNEGVRGSVIVQGAPADVCERLQEADWTFREASTRGQTHGVHPYPAKFIPQIPRQLISILHPRDGTAVLDPFCGSGTTLLEAALTGVPAVGIDLNPLACLISKAKVTPIPADLNAVGDAVLARAMKFREKPPTIPKLDHWFRKDIQQTLAALIRSIEMEPDRDVRDALRVAVSSIVVRVSNQESDTRYAAVEKDVTPEDVWDGFRKAVSSLNRAVAATWGALFPPPPVRIINKDILVVEPEEIGADVSLVVTSPPYPNAYEYWLYHKYRMYWLGMDPIAVRRNEIGARPHFFKRKPHTAEDFERQMEGVFRLLSRVVVPDGHACFQIGSSVIRGRVIDNRAILCKAAGRFGFEVAATMKRSIPGNRKAFNLSHARIKDEDLVVFRLRRR